MMLDIYHDLPATINSMLDHSEVVFWSGFIFPGAFGVEFESAWVRSPDNKIIWRKDEVSQQCDPHPANDWIVNGEQQPGFSWTLIREVHESHRVIIMCVRRKIAIDISEALKPRHSQRVEIRDDFKWTQFHKYPRCVLRWWKGLDHRVTDEVDVWRPLYQECSIWIKGRTRDTFSYSLLFNRARSVASNDSSFETFGRLFPLEQETIFTRTVYAAMSSTVFEENQFLDKMRDLAGASFMSFNTHRKCIGLQEPRRTWTDVLAYGILGTAAIFCAGSGICLVYRRTLDRLAKHTPELVDEFSTTVNAMFTGVFVLLKRCFEKVVEYYPSGSAASVVSLGNDLQICFFAFLEEVWKMLPGGFVSLVAFEAYKVYLEKGVAAMFSHIVLHWTMSFLSKKSLIFGTAIHAAWNKYVQLREFNIWKMWKTSAHMQVYPRARLSTVPGVYPIHIDDSFIQHQQFAHWPLPEQCKLIKVKGIFPASMSRAGPSTCHYLPTCVPLYRPRQSMSCMEVAVKCRILKKAMLSPKKQAIAWSDVPLLVPDSFAIISFEDHWEAWLNNYSTKPSFKYKRAKKYLEEYRKGATMDRVTINVMVKADEYLPFREDGLKPRTIHNLPPLVQAAIGPFIWGATQNWKKLWCHELRSMPIPAIGARFYFRYASSATDGDLTKWREEVDVLLLDGDWYVLVAGDDSVMWINLDGEIFAFEFDVSSYDQSESIGPLEYEYRCLLMLGVPIYVVNMLRDLAESPLRVCFKDGDPIILDRKRRPFRDTGGADTTLGNGIVNGGAIYHCALVLSEVEFNSPDDLADGIVLAMKGLGFKVTGGLRLDGSESFLKGLWYPTERGLVWGPAPSRVLKLGKAGKDPRHVFKEQDLATAVKMHARVVASGYNGFLHVPILRGYVEKWADRTLQVVEDWKIKTTFMFNECVLDMDRTYVMLYRRYGLTKQDIIEMEMMYAMSPLFSFLCHPGFWKLTLVDYGE